MPLYLFNVDIQLSDFNLKDASYDKKDTTIRISKDKPNLVVDISDMSFNFELNYKVQTDKDLLNDTGKFIVKVVNLEAKLMGSPVMVKTTINET